MIKNYICLFVGHLIANIISSAVYAGAIMLIPFLRGNMTELIWAVITQAIAVSLICNTNLANVKELNPKLLWLGMVIFVVMFFVLSYFISILYENIFS